MTAVSLGKTGISASSAGSRTATAYDTGADTASVDRSITGGPTDA
jgi:hypothetical protein